MGTKLTLNILPGHAMKQLTLGTIAFILIHVTWFVSSCLCHFVSSPVSFSRNKPFSFHLLYIQRNKSLTFASEGTAFQPNLWLENVLERHSLDVTLNISVCEKTQ